MKHGKWGIFTFLVMLLLYTTPVLLVGCAEPCLVGGSVKDEEGTEFLLTLPILEEIEQNTAVGTAGSFMTAAQSAVKLLDWGVNTGLDPKEIKDAAEAYIADKSEAEQREFAEKLALVDEAYKMLLRGDGEDLLSSAGCEDATYPQSGDKVESIEAVMEAAGLR